jgi:spermidine synthase
MTAKRNEPTTWLVLLFFCSGVAALGYQVVWAKFFSAGIGHEFPAVLAVITAFMAGMALGSGALHFLKEIRSAKLYAILELVIGCWGALTALLIPRINILVIHLIGPEPSHVRHWSIVFVAVLLTLLPATAAMGATFPALEKVVSACTRKRSVGLLYAANTAGALIGGLLTIFWWMPQFGIVPSLLLLAGFNFFSGVAALLLKTGPMIEENSRPAGNSVESQYKSAGHVFSDFLITGFLGIAYETVAIRALSHILENTVYTFAVVLAIYLLGTSIGAALFHNSQPQFKKPTILFPLLAMTTVGSALCLWFAQPLYSSLRLHLPDSLFSVAFAETLVAALLLLLPTIAMGAAFAFLAEQSLRFSKNLGIGLMVNTFGAALAPAVIGLLLIPNLGLNYVFFFIPLLYAALIPSAKLRVGFAAAVILGGFLFPNPKALIEKDPNSTFAFFREGVMATVSVLEDPKGNRVLKVNNRFQMGGTAARAAEERHADIPLLLHPNPGHALFIGLGTGITFATARYYPDLQAEGVELLPAVVEALPLFETNSAVLQNPRLETHVADGRRFVLTTTNHYDVIVADLFHPAQDGAGFLYAKEHFSAIRSRLAPNGLFCQWLPLYQMDLGTLRIITRTFLDVFPNAEAWLLRNNVDTPVIGLIARFASKNVDDSFLQTRLTDPILAEHLKRNALADTIRLYGQYLAGPESLRDFASGAEINTDLNPIVLFRAPLLTFRKNDDPSTRLLDLLQQFTPARIEFPIEPQIRSRLTEYIEARNVYLKGLSAEVHGDLQTAIAAYLDSARLSPDFTSGYAQCLAIATAMAKSNPATARMILIKLDQAQPNRPVARELLDRLQLTP